MNDLEEDNSDRDDSDGDDGDGDDSDEEGEEINKFVFGKSNEEQYVLTSCLRYSIVPKNCWVCSINSSNLLVVHDLWMNCVSSVIWWVIFAVNSKSVCVKPRVVIADVPSRIPEGLRADLSVGIVFLLTLTLHSSAIF